MKTVIMAGGKGNKILCVARISLNHLFPIDNILPVFEKEMVPPA